MYYEERKTVVVFYYARVKKEKISRTQACGIRLTEAQYMQKKWCNDEWLETFNRCKEHRSFMSGPAHRQGSSSLPCYKKKIMEEQEKRPVTDLAAYVASRSGSENGTLCNDRAQQVLERYTEAAKEKYGQDFDVINAPLDPNIVYKVGGGKNHGRHCIANGYIDSRVSVSRSQSSMSCGSSEDVRPSRRLRTQVDRINDLESKLEQMHQILISLQGQLNKNPIANNGTTPSVAGTPGTAGSVGNNTVGNSNNAQQEQEQVDECSDVVMWIWTL